MHDNRLSPSSATVPGTTRLRARTPSFAVKPLAGALAALVLAYAPAGFATYMTVDAEGQVASVTCSDTLFGIRNMTDSSPIANYVWVLPQDNALQSREFLSFWSASMYNGWKDTSAFTGNTFTNEGSITTTQFPINVYVGNANDANGNASDSLVSGAMTDNGFLNAGTITSANNFQVTSLSFGGLSASDSGTVANLRGAIEGNWLRNSGTIEAGIIRVDFSPYQGKGAGKQDDRNANALVLKDNILLNEQGGVLSATQEVVTVTAYSSKYSEVVSEDPLHFTYNDAYIGNGIDNAGTITTGVTSSSFGVFAVRDANNNGNFFTAAPLMQDNYIHNREGGSITGYQVVAARHLEVAASEQSGGTRLLGNYVVNEGEISVYGSSFSVWNGLFGTFVATSALTQTMTIASSSVVNEASGKIYSVNNTSQRTGFGCAIAVGIIHYTNVPTAGMNITDSEASNAGEAGYLIGTSIRSNLAATSDPAPDTVSDTRVFNTGTLTGMAYGVTLSGKVNADIDSTTVVNTGTGVYFEGVDAAAFSGTPGVVNVADTVVVNRGTLSSTLVGVVTYSAGSISDTTVVNLGEVGAGLYGAGHKTGTVNAGAMTGTRVFNARSAAIGGYAVIASSSGASVTDSLFVNADEASVDGFVYVSNILANGVESAESLRNEAHLSGGTLHDVVLTRLNSATLTDATVRDNKLYVTGDVDLSASNLTGLVSTNPDFDYSDAEAISGNELIFGKARTMQGEPDERGNLPEDLLGEFVEGSFTGGGRSIASVSGFNKITVTAADWGDENAIKVGTLSALAPDAGEDNANSKIVIDVSRIAFSSMEGVRVGDVTKILEADEVAGAMELTQEASEYTAGTTVTGTATAAITDEGRVVRYTVATKDLHVDSQEQTHTVPLSMAATTAALTQAGDLTASAAYGLTHSRIRGTQTYAVAAGEAARLSAGSHVSTRIFMLTAGLGNRTAYESGDLSLSLGVEAGYGKFRNAFDAGDADPYVNKRGHLHYAGAVFTSDWTSLTGWHVGATLRGGRSTTKMNGALYDASDASLHGVRVTSNYVGAELELGRVFKLSEGMDLDLYGKYLGLYQNGDAFTVGEADRYEVRSVTSNRVRLGARLTGRLSAENAWFAGAGLEREFDGRSEVVIANDGAATQAKPATLKGTRGLVEAGWRFDPESQTGLHYGFSVKGAFGSDYRAARAEARINYVF